jgi:hypothetical protein
MKVLSSAIEEMPMTAMASLILRTLAVTWPSHSGSLPGTVPFRATVPSGRREVSWSGFGKWPGAIALAAAILVGCSGAEASATPLTPFRYEAQAQRHCPHDQVVWLDFSKGVYYGKSQKRYGQGFAGSFVCLSEARDSLYRRSLLGLR